jgi:hypothetical protein
MFSKQDMHETLIINRPVDVLGYRLTYLGMTSQPYDRKNALKIRVEKNGNIWFATPHLYIAPWGGADQLFTNPPDIHNFFWGDLYIAHYRGPYSIVAKCPNNGMTMTRGDTLSYNGYTFHFHGLKWSDEVRMAMETGKSVENLPELRIHADMDAIYLGKSYPIYPELVYDKRMGAEYSVPAKLPGAPNAIISLSEAKLPFTGVLATTNLPDRYEMVALDVSVKPLIWLVWMGTILYTIGGLIAYRRRSAEFHGDH